MMSSTEADIKATKGMAWRACNKMDQIWKSNLNRTLKIRLLTSTVEAVLLYGCETWSLSKKQEQELDGCYTRMPRKALYIGWRDMLQMNCYMGTYQRFQPRYEQEG